MKDKLIEIIRSVPISNTYPEYVEALADKLLNKGYRKASEIAREIIADIEKIIEVDVEGEAKFDVRELFKIEKKYTEEGK